MESPLDTIIEWYESLPVSQRQDIAIVIAMSCPGFGNLSISTDSDKISSKFIQSLTNRKSSYSEEVGMALLVRAAIEFFFIRKHSEPDFWKNIEAKLRQLAKDKKSETFEKLANEKQFQSQQWKKTWAKWSKLTEHSLSDDYLQSYESQLN